MTRPDPEELADLRLGLVRPRMDRPLAWIIATLIAAMLTVAVFAFAQLAADRAAIRPAACTMQGLYGAECADAVRMGQ